MDIAQYGTAQHVEKLVGTFRTVSHIADYEESTENPKVIDDKKSDQKREEELHESRGLSYYQDDDGMWVIKRSYPQKKAAYL